MKTNRIKVLVTLALIVNCQLSIVNFSFAQINYQQDYKNAKELFQSGKYNLAMESFKRLMPYDKENPFSVYASFYYSLSAYKQNYKSVSKDMLNQIKILYPEWEKIDEVNYWLAIHLFEAGDSFQALKILNSIKNKSLTSDVSRAKQHYVSAITDAEILRMMLEEYPKDETIGICLAKYLAKNFTTAEERRELEKLVEAYHLDRDEYALTPTKPFFKDSYSVAVLFPFVVSKLDPSPSKKPNQFVLDMYQGIALAVDTLSKQGINISLRAYDTERNQERLKLLLGTEELRNTDLIIGPLLREDNALIQEFSLANKVNVVNPLANDLDMVKGNPYGFLFQPSYETLGIKAAQYLANDAVHGKKKCLVFYGSNVRDSVLAWNFIKQAEAMGVKVILKQEVFREESNKITEVLAKPTEFDEWKAPSQFTIPKDSIGAIFVASDDPMIYTKVVSAVETRKDNTLIIGSENWMDNGSIDLMKFQRLNFVLYAPNYVASTNAFYLDFTQRFIKEHGRTPSSLSINYARIGYELMLVLGHALKKYGVYIQHGLATEAQSGFQMQGFDFRGGNYNQAVPFVKFSNGSLEVLATY